MPCELLRAPLILSLSLSLHLLSPSACISVSTSGFLFSRPIAGIWERGAERFPILLILAVDRYYAPDRSSLPSSCRYICQGKSVPHLYDLYDLADFAEWESYSLHDLGRVSWVGSVPYRSCTASRNGDLGTTAYYPCKS